MSRRKNAGQGYGFNFHGAFTDKEDAEKKEKKTPNSFIRGRLTQHGYRWIVMSPRTNPIKRRRRRNPVPYRVVFTRHGQQHTWERFANTAAEATTSARQALAYEYPDRDYRLISVKPMSSNPIEEIQDPKIRRMIAMAAKLAQKAAGRGDLNAFHRHMQTIKLLEEELKQLKRENPQEKTISKKAFADLLRQAGYSPSIAMRGVTRSQALAFIKRMDEVHAKYSGSIEGPLFSRGNPGRPFIGPGGKVYTSGRRGTIHYRGFKIKRSGKLFRVFYPDGREFTQKYPSEEAAYAVVDRYAGPQSNPAGLVRYYGAAPLNDGTGRYQELLVDEIAKTKTPTGRTFAHHAAAIQAITSKNGKLAARRNPGELIVLGANPMPEAEISEISELPEVDVPAISQIQEINLTPGTTLTIRSNPMPICGRPVGAGMRCSRKPGHKGPHLPQGATLRPRSRVPGSWVGRRQNPSAAAIREEFTGRPSERYFVQDVAGMPAGDYAQLGELLALYVKPVSGGQRQQIDFRQGERPILLCDETRRQLYFLGGEQDVSGALPAFGVHHATGTEEILLGSLRRIDYKQRKEQAEQPELDEWRHELGEESHVFPDLYFDPVHTRLVVRGGEYEVRPEGIVN